MVIGKSKSKVSALSIDPKGIKTSVRSCTNWLLDFRNIFHYTQGSQILVITGGYLTTLCAHSNYYYSPETRFNTVNGPAEIPLETILLLVFLPRCFIFVPVSAY